MHAQLLDTRIEIQSATVTRGTSGGKLKAWAKHAEVWARRVDYSGNERGASASAGGEVAVARVEFTVRQRDDLNPTMRALHGGQIFNIQHIKPLVSDRGWMVLTCETGINDG